MLFGIRLSLRDIGFILKKGQLNHGIVTIIYNGNNSNNNNISNNNATTSATIKNGKINK